MPVHVVGAAIVAPGRVLVARRGPEMALAGKWEFPGGKVEDEEEPGESLVREIREELGVAIEVGELIGSGRAEHAGDEIRLDVYRCELVRGEPRAREHDELRWAGRGELEMLDWALADVPVVEELVGRWDDFVM